jgi:hypothetical protein
MSKSNRRYLQRAVGHPLAHRIPHILADTRLSEEAKLVALALLSMADRRGRVQASDQEIARRVAALQEELARIEGDS